MQGICFLLPLLLALVAVTSAFADVPRVRRLSSLSPRYESSFCPHCLTHILLSLSPQPGASGYFAPSDNTVDDATLSWTSFPNGASNMNHRPWVQPRVPTGPIVIPASSSIGPQYSNVLLPQPILPFASNFVSLPLRDGRATPNSKFADYTNHLAPPIFLETDATVSASSSSSAVASSDSVAEAAVAAGAAAGGPSFRVAYAAASRPPAHVAALAAVQAAAYGAAATAGAAPAAAAGVEASVERSLW